MEELIRAHVNQAYRRYQEAQSVATVAWGAWQQAGVSNETLRLAANNTDRICAQYWQAWRSLDDLRIDAKIPHRMA